MDRLNWFRDAKFGMFIHWGPYSALAGEWKGRPLTLDQCAEWIMNKLQIPAEEYREFCRGFNPVQFDAAEWMSLARAAGVRYVVFTSKHHDGFAMYHSRVSRYNIIDWTPFERDPLRELRNACAELDLRFGVYYSHREDWDEPYAYGNSWDFDFDPEKNLDAFEKKYLDVKAKPQLREILRNYAPVDLLWFDRGLYTQAQARDFMQLVREEQPDCIVNGRVGSYDQELVGDYQSLQDNGMPAGGIEEYWETPQTLNGTWGYSKFDQNWKTPAEVIRRLVRIVSCGGNYLLNIGPDGLGRIPPASVKVLREVGRWLADNGESVYGTEAGPFAELPWGACTRKGNRLFLHVTDWPEDGILVLPGLGNRVDNVSPLQSPDNSLPASRTEGGVSVDARRAPRDAVDTVLVSVLDGPPRVAPTVVGQDHEYAIELDYLHAVTRGRAVKRFNRKGAFHLSRWDNAGDAVTWQIDVAKPGEYTVRISYAANPEWAGQEYVVRVGDQILQGCVQATGDWYEYKTFDLGRISLTAPGQYEVSISPESSVPENLLYLRDVRLLPV